MSEIILNPTDAQVAELRSKYPRVEKITLTIGGKEESFWMRTPNRSVLSEVLKLVQAGETLDSAEIIVRNCTLAGTRDTECFFDFENPLPLMKMSGLVGTLLMEADTNLKKS